MNCNRFILMFQHEIFYFHNLCKQGSSKPTNNFHFAHEINLVSFWINFNPVTEFSFNQKKVVITVQKLLPVQMILMKNGLFQIIASKKKKIKPVNVLHFHSLIHFRKNLFVQNCMAGSRTDTRNQMTKL